MQENNHKNNLLVIIVISVIIATISIAAINSLGGQPKVSNEEVRINDALLLKKGYDVALSDGDDGFMYVAGVVKNSGETIAARDLKLSFDVLSGNKVVGACFMTNPKEIKKGESWHLEWDVWLSRCITEADAPNYSGDELEVDGVKYSSYSLGNKQYYDELLNF